MERAMPPSQAAALPEEEHNSAHVRTVFLGLVLGMLISSVSQTIVSPAMPRIVAELGGLDHYSWIALAALLTSTVAVPIVGKLSDLYGRKNFYVGGIIVFLLGSILSGVAPNFWMLVAARAVQGIGMGTMMPLSQAIIGDIIPPRDRGKYQGVMGAVFGVSSILGPLVGGYITDNYSWRWLFFVNLPIGVIALAVIIRSMHLPHVRRVSPIDYWGIATITVTLVTALLATSWGGTQYPWTSVQIIGLYAVAAVALVAFFIAEQRAPDPVVPFRLWKNSIFTLSNVATTAIAMGMFGSIFYIPVFIQGVLGESATNSGLQLIPMTIPMILTSVVTGLIISRTGRYKWLTVAGVTIALVAYYLLTLLNENSERVELTTAMVLLGLGLGASMQTFTLVVQNSSRQEDMGVATASTQLFRSIGSAVGVAVMGSLMTSGMRTDIPKHLSPEMMAQLQASGQQISATSALDPTMMAQLPPAALDGIRAGMAEALHTVFTAGLPFMAVALIATLLIRELPLRRTLDQGPHATAPAAPERAQATEHDRDVVPGRPAPRVPAPTVPQMRQGATSLE